MYTVSATAARQIVLRQGHASPLSVLLAIGVLAAAGLAGDAPVPTIVLVGGVFALLLANTFQMPRQMESR